MAPVHAVPLLLAAATAVVTAVASAAGVAAAAPAAAAAVRQRLYTAPATPAAAAAAPCAPVDVQRRDVYPPAGGGGCYVPDRPPRDGFYAPTRSPPSRPSGTSPPVAGTASPVASATPSPALSTPTPPPASTPTPPPSTPTPSPSMEAELPIPTLPPGCPPPSVQSVSSAGLFFSLVGWQWSAQMAVCDTTAARFRLTIYTAPAGATAPATRVYQAIERSGGSGTGNRVRTVGVPGFGGIAVRRSCEPRSIYGEACVIESTTRTRMCARTDVRIVDALPPPALRLNDPLPPPTLALAPADAVTLRANVTAGLDEDNRVPVGPPAVRLVAFVRRRDNGTRRSAPVVVAAGPAVIRNTLLAAGVAAADDGAVVGVEVSRAACPPGGASTVVVGGAPGGGTVLSVSAATPSLVVQDTRVPTIVSVVYPPTAVGEPVNLTVTATNEGGGRRRVGGDGGGTVPTALTYQWLKQGTAFSEAAGSTPPAVLAGETAAVLPLAAAACLNLLNSCGRFGCFGLEQYQVDVCNTFGCTRSRIIQPAILRPADEQQALELEQSSRCTFVS